LGSIKNAVNGDGVMMGKFVKDNVWDFFYYPLADSIIHKEPEAGTFLSGVNVFCMVVLNFLPNPFCCLL